MPASNNLRQINAAVKEYELQRNAKDCINNLRLIDAAKKEWVLAHNGKAGDVVTEQDLIPYIKLDSECFVFPQCPSGGTLHDWKNWRATDLLAGHERQSASCSALRPRSGRLAIARRFNAGTSSAEQNKSRRDGWLFQQDNRWLIFARISRLFETHIVSRFSRR